MARTFRNQHIDRLDLTTVANEPYVFAVVSKHRTIIGLGPETIVQSWKQVQHYYGTGWLIGWLNYEQGYRFMRPLKQSSLRRKKCDAVILPNVYVGVFKKVLIVDRITVPRVTVSAYTQWKPEMTKTAYRKKFTMLKNHIAIGNIYQANLSYRWRTKYTQSPLHLFSYLYHQQPTANAAFIKTPHYSVSSVSPELFLSVHKRLVETHPMKGTLQRSYPKRTLHNSLKDKAELDMIIDVHRNDLAHTAVPGSVQVIKRRRLRALPTVWQADAVIQSTLAKPYKTLDLIETSFPAGSITGAPKLRSMEILHELEPLRRNVYTGAIGYIAPTGDASFNVAIRTAYTIGQNAYYHVGGGVVFDSTADSEYQEALQKAKIIL